ncbi:MAG TPA: PQQ-binding-like beta-propeller repeat protein [Sedimentisphaerales bacterium]|nr:PQQ-binding-like beta-propeller repeat protein [Sedimentisphaerales bacterium]HRS09810.1 PQQ-binding-like beta-propeller repeat protein [Sedimentisphaerales bacterium]HRV46540.1 PQQ-binding-like beta-propeller repeat protein [Sedimentisphaerales bacterium]
MRAGFFKSLLSLPPGRRRSAFKGCKCVFTWPAGVSSDLLIDQGILAETDRGVALLDRTSLDVLWQIRDRRYGVVSAGRMVCSDDDGLVTCLSLDTGQDLWSYRLPGGSCIAAAKGKALLFHSAVRAGPKETPAVVLLDLETGRELLHKSPPPGIHYLTAYFDGEHIYLPSGAYTGEHIPDTSCSDQGRPSARFERMLVWDLAGTEVESIPAPADLDGLHLDSGEGFALGDKVFSGHRVWERLRDVPRACYPAKTTMPTVGESRDWEYRKELRFNLKDGFLIVAGVVECRESANPHFAKYVAVELRSLHGNWTGRLPCAENLHELVSVAMTEDRFFLATVFGHVEAIDRASGEPLWMYVCGDAQRHWPESGLRLEGRSEPPHPVIIFDPEPDLRPPAARRPRRRVHPLLAAYDRIVQAVRCLALALRRKTGRN